MSAARHRFRAAFAISALFLLAASRALAVPPGLGVAWNHCQGEGGAVQNLAFACDTNVGADFAYGTFTLVAPFAQLQGTDSRLALVAASPVLPAWWGLGAPPDCRTSSLVAQPVPDPSATVCEDWAQGLATGLVSYCTPGSACSDPSMPANTASLLIGSVVPVGEGQDLVADQTYFVFSIRINHAKTVGAGACGGCEVPVCITFNSLRLAANDVLPIFITTASSPGGNILTWQGGAGAPGCMGATPTKRATWGSVKSLYR